MQFADTVFKTTLIAYWIPSPLALETGKERSIEVIMHTIEMKAPEIFWGMHSAMMLIAGFYRTLP